MTGRIFLYSVMLNGLFFLVWCFLPFSILLVTDIFIFIFIESLLVFLIWAGKQEHYREVGRRVKNNFLAFFSLCIITIYFLVSILDSIHYRPYKHDNRGNVLLDKKGNEVYSEVRSFLDTALARVYRGIRDENDRIIPNFENSYSAPLADKEFNKKIITDLETGKISVSGTELQEKGVHILGTGKAGSDIFYKVLKGTRTAIIVGLVTTLIAIPFAMFFGICAGYFGGKVDDLIQFIYTTISSVPSILLISGLYLIIKSRFRAESSSDILRQDDFLLLGLCIILGLLGWSHLCRLLRAETLKIRELDFVQAARTLGSSHPVIIMKHIVPNVLHIVLITFILNFSGLVMVETILSYLKIGVPSTIGSWGRIIDEARDELSRDPMITWPLLSSFFAMFILILAVNFLGDVIRDALDPRLRKA